MLGRRLLRIKTLQALYGYCRAEGADIKKAGEQLAASVEKTYELYALMLLLIADVAEFSQKLAERSKNKLLPPSENLYPDDLFSKNMVIKLLAGNARLAEYARRKKLSWLQNQALLKKIFSDITAGNACREYLSAPAATFSADKDFIIKIYAQHIFGLPELEQYLEDHCIHWASDFDQVNMMVMDNLKHLRKHDAGKNSFEIQQHADDNETEFVINLFNKTIHNEKQYGDWIGKKAKNWKIERISFIDILLMKMAACELLEFPAIPVKVTLNEYIEIAKQYSTPQSSLFINGILDKLLADFKIENRIIKTGRGVIE